MTAVSVVVVYFFFIGPLLKNIEDGLKEIASIRVSTERLEQEVDLSDNGEKLKSFLRETNQLFVDGGHPANTVLFLRETANLHNVDKEIIEIEPKESVENYWPYFEVEMTFSGSQENFFNFLEEIEANKFLIDIKEATIRKDSNEEKTLQGSILLNFFTDK